jgi:glycosyltransferase involved in cell wall biosynthesis
VARLLFVTGTPADVRSGSGTFVGISVLRSALEAAGHHVDVLAPARERAMPTATGRLLFNIGIRSRAAEMARGADAVVGFDLDGLFLRRGGNARHVAALKGVLAEEARFEHGTAALRLRAEAFLEKLHVRRAGRVIATSAHSARRIVEDYGIPSERIRIVPEPIDLARWTAILEAAPSVEGERRGDAALTSVLCVAHLYPRKNVGNLLEAFARVGSEATLRIVGTGPEAERLAQRARRPDLAGRVELLGHVSFERLAAEYRRADVFCLPSRQEGFGIVFLEAMAAGLPIVAARAAAVPEVVVDGECGLLVPPEDAGALCGALQSLLSDAALRQRLGEGGRRRVRDYDAPAVASRFLEALDL